MTAIYTTTKNGKTATRKSAHHATQQYFFAVWAGDSCEAYSSRRDLAEARAAQIRHYGDVSVEPVTCEFKVVKERVAVDFPATEFERSGIKFVQNPKWPRGRIGEYRGYTISLHCSGKTFRASAEVDGAWVSGMYVAAGSLDTRIALMKTLIDAKLDAKVEA